MKTKKEIQRKIMELWQDYVHETLAFPHNIVDPIWESIKKDLPINFLASVERKMINNVPHIITPYRVFHFVEDEKGIIIVGYGYIN